MTASQRPSFPQGEGRTGYLVQTESISSRFGAISMVFVTPLIFLIYENSDFTFQLITYDCKWPEDIVEIKSKKNILKA